MRKPGYRLLLTVLFSLTFISFYNVLYGQNEFAGYTITDKKLESLKSAILECRIDTLKTRFLLEWCWSQFNQKQDMNEKTEQEFLAFLDEGLSLSIKAKERWKQGQFLLIQAYYFGRKGNHGDELKNYYKILEIAKAMDDKACLATQYANIANVYRSQGSEEEAVKLYDLSYKTALESSDPKIISNANRRMGDFSLRFTTIKEREPAVKYFIQAVDAALKTRDASFIALNYAALAKVYMVQADFSHAIPLYYKSIDLLLKTNQNPVETYMGLAWIYYANAYFKNVQDTKASIDSAIKYFGKAEKVGQLTRSKQTLSDAYYGLFQAYSQKKDFERSQYYTELFYKTRDSMKQTPAPDKSWLVRLDYEKQKAILEEKGRQQILLLSQKAESDKQLARQKFEENEKLSFEKFEKQKLITDQKNLYEQSLASEKLKQEKVSSEKRQLNTIMWMSIGSLILILFFSILFIKQKNQKTRALEKAELNQKMIELEMQSLRAQLNPHFMFNSLNSIQTLILKQDTERSRKYLSTFSSLLRLVLENAREPFIPLNKEIELLQMYLGLENLRMPDLKYDILVDSSVDPEKLLIPNMILQPYVENAIWHGLSEKQDNRQLQIRISRYNGTVQYEIEDNGIGIKKSREKNFKNAHHSMGMELLAKRFNLIKKDTGAEIKTSISEVMNRNEVGGTIVTIKTPVQFCFANEN
jgi:tetratricopeptide (TPR) repeat protein